MNERIDHCLYQAGLTAQGCWEDLDTYTQEGIEKFAELIVKECISINRQRMFSDYEGDTHRVAHNNALLCANSDMFEHFGVEE